jgi:hypothetical protein
MKNLFSIVQVAKIGFCEANTKTAIQKFTWSTAVIPKNYSLFSSQTFPAIYSRFSPPLISSLFPTFIFPVFVATKHFSALHPTQTYSHQKKVMLFFPPLNSCSFPLLFSLYYFWPNNTYSLFCRTLICANVFRQREEHLKLGSSYVIVFFSSESGVEKQSWLNTMVP